MILQNINRTSGLFYSKLKFCFQVSVPCRNFNFFWSFLNKIFNAVDKERLKLLGPDRTCAEWLLRNGATIRFKGHSKFLTDYNELIALEELPESSHFHIEEIFGREAALSTVGFEHLKNCNHITKITFIFCPFLSNQCLYKLRYISHTLQYLEIRSCFSIEDDGILTLTELRNLKTLILDDLAAVKKKDKCEAALRNALKHCVIEFKE